MMSRLKLLKRKMFDWTRLDLLARRIPLAAAPGPGHPRPQAHPDPHRASSAFLTKSGHAPNGMKLDFELLLCRLLTQCSPGFDHERETLGPPLLDARLHPMGAYRDHNQCH